MADSIIAAAPHSQQATVFSSAVFCHTWADVHRVQWQALGPERDLAAIYTESRKLRLRHYSLSAAGLYWGNSNVEEKSDRAFVNLVDSIRHQWNCASLTWYLRSGAQQQLDLALAKFGQSQCKVTEAYTHVVSLNGLSFEQIMEKHVKPVTRQQIRYGLASGIEIRKIDTRSSLDKHYALYEAWAKSKKVTPYQKELFRRLVENMGSSISFIGAFVKDDLVAAILVFMGKQEWLYWHSIRDIRESKHFATDVLLAHVLREACAAGVSFFNMGASNQIKSLEFFKERWGAEPQPTWTLRWENPLWQSIIRLRQARIHH